MQDPQLLPVLAGLETLSGVGPKMSRLLERLTGGSTIRDLLLHLPDRWITRQLCAQITDSEAGETAIIRGEVTDYFPPHHDRLPWRIRLADDSGEITLVYFRADPRWIRAQFTPGEIRVVSGKVEMFRGERQITHPDWVVDPARGPLPASIEPVYPLTSGVTNRRLHGLILQALGLLPDTLPEWADPHLVASRGWPAFRQALSWLHDPTEADEARFDLARERLAYDEALARASAFAIAQAARRQRVSPIIRAPPAAINTFIDTLPYRPTNAQLRAGAEISADMARGFPMRRLLQGDVGSGKTLVAAFAAVETAASGYQAAFMAPTEVLARQQFETLSAWLTPLGYRVGALSGRDRLRARKQILSDLENGAVAVITGTHALFQEDVRFRNLGLIIVDEQHRFGVTDRMRLARKGDNAHMLVMSATPIPRTLAQAVHGDLDISILDEKPAGRKPVATRAIPDTRLSEVIEAVGRAIERDERVFWVCPRVDADEDTSSAAIRHQALESELGVTAGLVHGRLKPAEKDKALEDFRCGRTRLLVATTVIEVGVNVPEATIMVIERAEGFGLAQLHQLRGRVGRGSREAFCLLLYRPPLGETARQRLDTLRQTEDGFEIAEADFRLRGAGDVLGVRQAGAADYRIIDLARDADLLAISARDAAACVTADPGLAGERSSALRLARLLLTPRLS